ncbi:MAG: glycosyltransferase family 39 protein [Candidatus Xenobia bacterium]
MPQRLLVALLVVACWLVASACLSHDPVGTWSDDAAFALQARIYGGVATPHGEALQTFYRSYLPGHALLLAPVAALTGGSLTAMREVSIACMICAALGFMLYARTELPPWQALALAACIFFTPATMLWGTAVFSDVSFLPFMVLALLLARRIPDAPSWMAWLVGVLLAWLCLIRLAGVPVGAGIVLWLASQRQWPAAGRVAAGASLASLPFVNVYRTYFLLPVYREFLKKTGRFSHIGAWWLALPKVLGESFLGLPAPVAVLGGVALLVLAVLGLRRPRLDLVAACLGPLLLYYMLFPFLEPRYLFPVYPLLLLLALRTPRISRAVVTVILLTSLCGVAPVVAASQTRRDMSRTRWAAYTWLREHTPPDALVMDRYGPLVGLYADRASVAPTADLQTWSELLAEVSVTGAQYLVIRPVQTAARSVTGLSEASEPARLDAWADASSLLSAQYRGPIETVYRTAGVGRDFYAIYHDYCQACTPGTPDAETTLRRCLQRYPDFPEARSALALSLLQRDGNNQEAIALLRSVVDRYPMDVLSGVNLCLCLSRQKRDQEALGIKQALLARDTELGLPPQQLELLRRCP